MEDRYLFKAKRISDGEWVQGYLFDDGFENGRIFIGGLVIEKYNGTACDDWNVTGIDFCEVDPSTICQCTGLKDKNGKLIWENDIVKKEFYIDYDSVYQEEYVTSVISKKYVGTVKFEHFAWVVETFNDKLKCILPICELSEHSEDIKHFEVIGNIFDDKELEKGE